MPSSAGPLDPIAARIRDHRRRQGLSLRSLASLASQRITPSASRSRASGVSTAYLCLIENGHKVPDERVARAIAEALGDDPSLYSAWVAARKRCDLPTALAAARRLAESLERVPPVTAPPSIAPSSARIRVPVIREGEDPGEGLRPTCPVAEWLRLDLGRIEASERDRLDRPVAWRVREDTRQIPDLRDGIGALLLRRFLPLAPGALHAVRLADRVSLRRVVWNGRQLLLLPAPGSSDFEVLEADGEHRLRSRILGAVLPIELDEA